MMSLLHTEWFYFSRDTAFDVDMDQLTGSLPLVAPRRFRRGEVAHAIQANAREHRTDGGPRQRQSLRDLRCDQFALPQQSNQRIQIATRDVNSPHQSRWGVSLRLGS